MTENETIKRVEEFGLHHAIGDLPNSALTVKSFEMAIEALREIQQYRAIGTVEQLSNALENVKTLSRMYEKLNDQEVAECHKLLEYEKIGTVEECQEAREKQIAKKPIHGGLYACPNCHTIMLQGAFEAKGKCRKECGQALDWSETV